MSFGANGFGESRPAVFVEPRHFLGVLYRDQDVVCPSCGMEIALASTGRLTMTSMGKYTMDCKCGKQLCYDMEPPTGDENGDYFEEEEY